MDTVAEAIARIQTYLRKKAEAALTWHSCAPFSVLAERSGDPPQYAIPDRPLVDGLEQVITELQVHAGARHAQARVQFIQEYAPAFAAALRRAGFGEVWRSRVMACYPHTLLAPKSVPGLGFKTLSSQSSLEDVLESWHTNARGFGEEAAALSEAIEQFREQLISGRAFTALLSGAPVAAAMFTEIRRGVTELIGVATLEAYRGRGIAPALTAHAARTAFDSGADLMFLATNSDTAAGVYQRVGFQNIGWLVEFSENPAEWAAAQA